MLFEAMFNEHHSLHTVRNCEEKELLEADLACHTALSKGWLSFSKWNKLFSFSLELTKAGAPCL